MTEKVNSPVKNIVDNKNKKYRDRAMDSFHCCIDALTPVDGSPT